METSEEQSLYRGASDLFTKVWSSATKLSEADSNSLSEFSRQIDKVAATTVVEIGPAPVSPPVPIWSELLKRKARLGDEHAKGIVVIDKEVKATETLLKMISKDKKKYPQIKERDLKNKILRLRRMQSDKMKLCLKMEIDTYEREYASYERNKREHELRKAEDDDRVKLINLGKSIKKYLSSQKGLPGVLAEAGRVNWRILPRGAWKMVIRHFQDLAKKYPQYNWDLDRLQYIGSLHPVQYYIGMDEFEGYIVFFFEGRRRAFLENPIAGNAFYVIESDWQTLCRLSKHDLLSRYARKVCRIVHRGEWKIKVGQTIRSKTS